MSVETRRKEREPKTETEKALMAQKTKEGLQGLAIGPVTGLLGLPSDIIDLADMANDAIAKYGEDTTIAQFSKLIKPQLDAVQEKYGRDAFDKGFTELTGIKSDPTKPAQFLGELVSLGSIAKTGVKGAKLVGETISDTYKGAKKLFEDSTLPPPDNLAAQTVGATKPVDQLEQTKKLLDKIGQKNLIVDYAMRYGNPSIKSKIYKLQEIGCERLIVLPLYPQYAAATTATVCDEVYRVLMDMRWQPSLQIIPHYESEPLYIKALSNSLNLKISELSWKPDLILASYHGIPQKYFDKGDPYHCYCHKTTRLLSEEFKAVEIKTTFQSRFGPEAWLKPYTDKTLEDLPNEGKKNLLVICPGFSSDCVETLEEISIQGKESFLKSGGKNFDVVPCLNDNDDHIILLEKLTKKFL